MLFQQTTLNCKGYLLDIAQPIVMGVLNVTPDSFYDGGKYSSDKLVLQQVETMLKDGASIIDIGGMSSRPGAEIISEETELKRVLPVIQSIVKSFPQAILSIDTIRGKIAHEAIDHGVSIINDISAGALDKEMFKVVAKLNVPYILMHMKGKPKTMQQDVVYENLILDMLDFFIEKVGILREFGLKDIIIDPGFGFGKEIEHNFRLIKNLNSFKILDCPILVGVSRKSFIYKTLNISTEEALTGTIALNMAALQNGAKILRVHDVKEAIETIKIWQALENG